MGNNKTLASKDLIKKMYITNGEAIQKYLNQKECFENFEEVVNLSSQINRELYIAGIDDEMSSGVEALIRFWNRCDEQEGIPVEERKPIKLYIDSWGGELVAAFTIINAIELSKTPVWTISIGAAYSAGFFIYIAGHKRLAYNYSSFLFHEGSPGSPSVDAHKFRNYADFYIVQLNQLKEHTLKYTKLTEEEYRKVQKDDYWLTAQQALEKGVVDEIITKESGI